MADAKDLQAQIEALSGKIQQHKHQRQQSFARGGHHGHNAQYSPPPYRGQSRWAPYSHAGKPHKNRTLVLNGPPTPPDGEAQAQTTLLVTARGTNNQLMTKDVYDREQKQKIELKQRAKEARRQQRFAVDQDRIRRRFGQQPVSGERLITVQGVQFRLTDDGTKLTRLPDSSGIPTPRKYSLDGVDFLRTKRGNLILASALKVSRYTYRSSSPHGYSSLKTHSRPPTSKTQCEHFTKHGSYQSNRTRAAGLQSWTQTAHRRPSFTGQHRRRLLTQIAGTCPFGPQCHFAHDPDRVAICRDFLKTATCPRGGNCDLSHDMTFHRVPACQYFLRGNCTNDACRYPHVHVSPAAPVCRAFATLGFCGKGEACDKRHVHECPDHTNSGFCAKLQSGKCPLPHPERASTIRKMNERQAKLNDEAASDVSSDAEDVLSTMEDVDSENEGIVMGGNDDSHELFRQQDFVSFA